MLSQPQLKEFPKPQFSISREIVCVTAHQLSGNQLQTRGTAAAVWKSNTRGIVCSDRVADLLVIFDAGGQRGKVALSTPLRHIGGVKV